MSRIFQNRHGAEVNRRIVFLHEIVTSSGGSSSSMINLVQFFAKKTSVIVVGPSNSEWKNDISNAGSEFFAIPSWLWKVSFSKRVTSVIKIVLLQAWVRCILKKNDLLIVNGILGEFIAGFGFILSRCTRLYFVRGAVGESKLWKHMSFRGLKAMIAVSSFVKNQIAENLPNYQNKVVVVPNIVKVPKQIHRAPPHRNVIIGCVGYLSPLKNQMLVVQAFSILRGLGLEVELVFYGKPLSSSAREYQEAIKVFINENNLENYVKFVSHANHEDIYGRIDILVSASVSEGFGKTIAEAMAYGLPAVALASAGGPRDIIRDPGEGILLEEQTPQALARALRALVIDPMLRARMGQRARAAVASRFAPEVVFPMLENAIADARP